MTDSRPDGFYWVRTSSGALEIARLHAGEWLLTGTDQPFAAGDFRHISGRLTAPGERMPGAELAGHLVHLARINGYALGYELQDLEQGKARKQA